MNRPGQPPQRPPSLGPNPGLAGSFRTPYPPYGILPRNVNVLQGGFVPGIQPRSSTQQQQQQQSMVPNPSPGFIQPQPRNQSTFPFGGIGQQTPSQQQLQQQQQQQPTTPLQQHSNTLLQSQQSNGASTVLLPHLTQSTTTPSLTGTTTTTSSASDVGLDPNDFPALGSSTPSNAQNSTGNPGVTASYASQAGTAVLPGTGTAGGGGGGAGTGTAGGNGNQLRDFTPDDFPALGGQPQTSSSQNQDHSHPPGLNGFQHTDHSSQQQQQQHRQSLLGSIQSGTPGMLNIGVQARSVHPGFQQQTQTEVDKQRNNYSLKLNQATHAAWNSPNVNPSSQSQIGSGIFATINPSANNTTTATTTTATTTLTQQTNGTHNQNTQNSNSSLQQQSQNSNNQSQHLNAPPGVPPPPPPPTNSFAQQSQQSQAPGGNTAPTGNTNPISTPAPGASYLANGMGLTPQEPHNHPQTPAQQILMSAADRWGLLGLLAMIKSAGNEIDGGLSSVGTDLGTMGLDVGYSGNLYPTFITPWADQSAAHTVEPDFHLPACYNVQTPTLGASKAVAFSDETLFFMFYSSPRDALQEIAAQELFNRNWRYHKELRQWITKETGTPPSQKVQGGEQGTYTLWDPENWLKDRKEMTVLYVDLEDKSSGLMAQPQNQTLGQGQIQQQTQQQQRGTFQMGMTGL